MLCPPFISTIVSIRRANPPPPGTNVLAMIPDTGERYLSTDLMSDIPSEMTEEELALSQSTEGAAPPTPPILSGILPSNTDELFGM